MQKPPLSKSWLSGCGDRYVGPVFAGVGRIGARLQLVALKHHLNTHLNTHLKMHDQVMRKALHLPMQGFNPARPENLRRTYVRLL
jgi:glutamate formiminotransferase